MTSLVLFLKRIFLINAAQKQGDEKLNSLRREILAVPESVSLTALLERFLKDRQHIAMVAMSTEERMGL